jgi:two-component system, NarL family, nitrate/nitrite response regulator NarL
MSIATPELAAPSSTITVVIANGEPLYGEAIERVVRQCARFELAGHVADARAALDRLRSVRPDIAVLGPSLPGLDGRRMLGLIRAEQIPTRLLFVGDDFDDETTYDLLGEGAAGVLGKTTGAEQLREAILAAAAGREVLCGETLSAVTREIRLRNRDGQPRLSAREREILGRIADGETPTTMARAMHLGLSTVKTHCAHLFDKLGVSNRAQAVAEGFRRGLLD